MGDAGVEWAGVVSGWGPCKSKAVLVSREHGGARCRDRRYGRARDNSMRPTEVATLRSWVPACKVVAASSAVVDWARGRVRPSQRAHLDKVCVLGVPDHDQSVHIVLQLTLF
jgi:hypothetical protein